MAQHYDRKAEDLGNITGRSNTSTLQIPDQAQGNSVRTSAGSG